MTPAPIRTPDRIADLLTRPERRWVITTSDGRVESGHLPAWATDDPSEHLIPPDQIEARLADINHCAAFAGQTARVYTPARRDGLPVEEEILRGSVDCNPYAPAGEPRIPVVNIHVAAETWLTGLGPEDLAGIATRLRAQADLLLEEVLPALITARADWQAHASPTSTLT